MRLVFLRHLRYQIDMTKESVENIARKLADAVPEGLKSVREDLEGNFRSVLQASLAKLDLVTREEFEIQEAVLTKTRSKLEALEARLEEIEDK
jgi:ubiquinone biosynthesis accessory factor UbiK